MTRRGLAAIRRGAWARASYAPGIDDESDKRGGLREGPFRGTAIALWSPTRRKARDTMWAALAATVVSIGGAIATESFLGFFFGGMAGALVVASWGYARARSRMQRLPFAVRHEPCPPGTFTLNPVSIRDVRIALAQPLTPAVLDGAVADASAQVPSLVVRVERGGRAISLARWTWASRDLEVLMGLLGRWGRQLHEVGTISEVVVTWDGYANR